MIVQTKLAGATEGKLAVFFLSLPLGLFLPLYKIRHVKCIEKPTNVHPKIEP